jgi:hypothetical protein
MVFADMIRKIPKGICRYDKKKIRKAVNRAIREN